MFVRCQRPPSFHRDTRPHGRPLTADPDPRPQLTSTCQYNSARGRRSLNARFSWEYRPLSYLYVVLNDATAAGPNEMRFTTTGREILVKLVFLGRLQGRHAHCMATPRALPLSGV